MKKSKRWWNKLDVVKQTDYVYKKLVEKGIYDDTADTAAIDWRREYDKLLARKTHQDIVK